MEAVTPPARHASPRGGVDTIADNAWDLSKACQLSKHASELHHSSELTAYQYFVPEQLSSVEDPYTQRSGRQLGSTQHAPRKLVPQQQATHKNYPHQNTPQLRVPQRHPSSLHNFHHHEEMAILHPLCHPDVANPLRSSAASPHSDAAHTPATSYQRPAVSLRRSLTCFLCKFVHSPRSPLEGSGNGLRSSSFASKMESNHQTTCLEISSQPAQSPLTLRLSSPSVQCSVPTIEGATTPPSIYSDRFLDSSSSTSHKSPDPLAHLPSNTHSFCQPVKPVRLPDLQHSQSINNESSVASSRSHKSSLKCNLKSESWDTRPPIALMLKPERVISSVSPNFFRGLDIVERILDHNLSVASAAIKTAVSEAICSPFSPASWRGCSSKQRGWTVLQLLLFLLLLVVAGADGLRRDSTCLGSEFQAPKKYVFDEDSQVQLALTLATSERVSHRLATAIFRIFLSEKVGYQNVTVVKNDSWSNGEPFDWVGEAMINLEVWIPPGSSVTQTSKTINCGSQGSGGRFGWYIANSGLFDTKDLITDHWRTFTRPDSARLFALSSAEVLALKDYTHINKSYFCPKDCEEGIFTPQQCENNTDCAMLIVGDYDSSSFLPNQVRTQELLVCIAWIGPNLTPQFINHFRSADKGLVFFSWWPGTLSTLPRVAPVSFPSCTSADRDNNCQYELHTLEKHVRARIEDTAAVAYQSVERFLLEEEDYDKLLEQYRNATIPEGDLAPLQEFTDGWDQPIIDRIACEWLTDPAHLYKLHNWTPMYHDKKPKLWIGGIFPINESGRYSSKELVHAARLAEDRINSHSGILNNYQLSLISNDGACSSEKGLSIFIDYITKGSHDYTMHFNQMAGILGPACSDTVEPLAGVAKHFHTVIISYSAEGAVFNDEVKFPYFFRTIPENMVFKYVYLNLFKKFEWKRIASLTQTGNKYSEYLTSLLDTIQPHGMFLDNHKFSGDTHDMSRYLQRLKDQSFRIIIGDFYVNVAREVMCEAYHLNMTAEHGYVWFLPRWFSKDWHLENTTDETGAIKCSTQQLMKAVDGHLTLGYAYYAPDDTVYHENITVKGWREKYREFADGEYVPDYAGYTYDAMWTYAFALDKLLSENFTHYADLHSVGTNSRFVEILKETNFTGVSGHLNFNNALSKKTAVNIMQARSEGNETQYFKLGYFEPDANDPMGGRLYLDSPIVWRTEGGLVPTDGSTLCWLAFIADPLNISCEAAIVMIMFSGFGVFAALLVALFLVYKRRLEKLRSPILWPKLEEYEIPLEKIVMNRTIGHGQFGTVYGGEVDLGGDRWVAAAFKALKVGSTDEDKLDFLEEAKMMKIFDHPNIVKLLGLAISKEPLLMVMEFMLHGDLKVYLLARRHLVNTSDPNNDADEISSRRLTKMALDVCCALAYLAEKRYVHRDVACRNCLVNVDLVVKLGDFGMSRQVHHSNYYRFSRKGMLPVRWMAPESLDDYIFTTATDVWSFGVVIYEIVTFANIPFHDMSSTQVMEHVKKGNTIPIPTGTRKEVQQLMQRCWSWDPNDRPSFNELVELLTNNPRLIWPCVDMPLASVEMQDEGRSVPNFRKMSGPLRNPANSAVRLRGPSPVNSLPNHNSSMHNTSPLSQYGDSFDQMGMKPMLSPQFDRSPHLDNGNGPAMEPLLPLSKDSYVTR